MITKSMIFCSAVRCRQALDEQLDFYMYEHETKLLREKLRAMEEQSQQIQRDREMRLRAEDGERY